MRPDDLRRDPAFQTAVGQLCSNHNAASCRAKAPGSVLSIFAVAGFMCDLCLGPDNLSLHCTALHCTACARTGQSFPGARKNTPSFPRRRKSILFVIPAKAGIHNSRVRGNSSSHYPNARKNTPSFPRRLCSILFVIPAKAGIHNSRARGNSSSYYPNA